MNGTKRKRFIVMDSKDNCATSIDDIKKDEEVEIEIPSAEVLKINVHHEIPLGHKIAIKNIKKGELILKYGEVIGKTTEAIDIGDWIHTHNITSAYLEANIK